MVANKKFSVVRVKQMVKKIFRKFPFGDVVVRKIKTVRCKNWAVKAAQKMGLWFYEMA
jgi:hypothetical protein